MEDQYTSLRLGCMIFCGTSTIGIRSCGGDSPVKLVIRTLRVHACSVFKITSSSLISWAGWFIWCVANHAVCIVITQRRLGGAAALRTSGKGKALLKLVARDQDLQWGKRQNRKDQTTTRLASLADFSLHFTFLSNWPPIPPLNQH